MKRIFTSGSHAHDAIGVRHALGAILAASALMMAATPASAGSDAMRAPRAAFGEPQGFLTPVLPARAKPYGYSLETMARLTADFNVSDRSAPPPNSPFQILYVNGQTGSTTFEVARNTVLYVPLLYNDDSLPVIGHLPVNAENRRDVLRYWYSQREFGVTTMLIVVDGKAVSLGAGHVSGVSFAHPLPDGATQYLTAAAFIGPLGRGPHTVEIQFKATGDALREPPIDQFFPDGFWEFTISYTVNVR